MFECAKQIALIPNTELPLEKVGNVVLNGRRFMGEQQPQPVRELPVNSIGRHAKSVFDIRNVVFKFELEISSSNLRPQRYLCESLTAQDHPCFNSQR